MSHQVTRPSQLEVITSSPVLLAVHTTQLTASTREVHSIYSTYVYYFPSNQTNQISKGFFSSPKKQTKLRNFELIRYQNETFQQQNYFLKKQT